MRMREQRFIIEDLAGGHDGLDILKKIEAAGRTCYKSEDRITDHSAEKFVRTLIRSGHHSVLEHHNVTVRIITNRGVTHELVRHRIAAYSQESTRYCDYGDGEIEFIWPSWIDLQGNPIPLESREFLRMLQDAERNYKLLRANGWLPQQAREILPNALKTEIVMTANLREWRHVFRLRCGVAAHPQIRELMRDGLRQMAEAIPVVFEDLYETFCTLTGEVS